MWTVGIVVAFPGEPVSSSPSTPFNGTMNLGTSVMVIKQKQEAHRSRDLCFPEMRQVQSGNRVEATTGLVSG